MDTMEKEPTKESKKETSHMNYYPKTAQEIIAKYSKGYQFSYSNYQEPNKKKEPEKKDSDSSLDLETLKQNYMKSLNKENNELMSNEKMMRKTESRGKKVNNDEVRSSFEDLLSSFKAGHFKSKETETSPIRKQVQPKEERKGQTEESDFSRDEG